MRPFTTSRRMRIRLGPIRFDTTSEPVRKKSRPKAASAIRYLKTSGEANANPCSSTASVPTPGILRARGQRRASDPIPLGRRCRFGVISPFTLSSPSQFS